MMVRKQVRKQVKRKVKKQAKRKVVTPRRKKKAVKPVEKMLTLAFKCPCCRRRYAKQVESNFSTMFPRDKLDGRYLIDYCFNCWQELTRGRFDDKEYS